MTHWRVTARASAAAVVMLSVAAACAGSGDRPSAFAGGADSAAGAATLRVATPQPAGSGSPDFCQVIPLDSVAATLQQTIGKVVTVAVAHAGAMCTYRDSSSGVPKVRAVIDVSHLRSPGSAGATLYAMRAEAGTQGITVRDVPGVGDAAFGSSDTTGSYDVTAQGGPFLAQVTVSAPGTDPKALRAAAAALAARTLAAMH